MKFKEAVTYDDMLMVPQYSDIQSRSEVDISSELGRGKVLELPVIASPMDTVSEDRMAIAMNDAGGMAILHRYNTVEEQQAMAQRVIDQTDWSGNVAAAIGVTGDYMRRAEALVAVGIDTLCVDVAHGHHLLMKEALKNLREEYDNHIHIMAGNVCTVEGVNDLADWGADSVRCNIGGGSICSTRVVTGHGLPGLQTIFDCARTDRDVAIIADGGIKNSGDIVKALAAGADFVLCGSLLAGTTETPGGVVCRQNGYPVKEYRGMASKDAQLDWRNKSSTPEGVASYIPYKGSVVGILQDLEGGIKSGFSYSGARSLTELRNKVEWARQTSAGTYESGTHILNTHNARRK
jgi:IMP dehydrogenase